MICFPYIYIIHTYNIYYVCIYILNVDCSFFIVPPDSIIMQIISLFPHWSWLGECQHAQIQGLCGNPRR